MMSKHDEPWPNSNATDTTDHGARSSHPGGGFFEIHVKGHLSSEWSDWLEGMEVRLLDNGEMILFGTIVDQAALMGILNKLNRLNLTLLSVRAIDQTESH
jgi:hypothetical protein